MSFYGTTAGADTYHSDRGNSAWAESSVTTAQKEEALLRASEYIDYQFRSDFPGYPTDLRDQTREWPRAWAYDIYFSDIPNTEVPVEVLNATYEAALRELSSPGSLLPDFTPNQQAKREKVGPIEVEYTGPVGPESAKPILTIVRGILQPILTGPASASSVGKAVRV